MKHFLMAIVLSPFLFTTAAAQSFSGPVVAMNSNDTTKPVIFYLSGDGGWTAFSRSFTRSLNRMGYPVIGLDSHDYFWKKKTPQEAADKVSGLLHQYLGLWKRKEIILVGYSFGADVAPFIQARLDPVLAAEVRHVVMMLPYKSTDFEIHLSEMLGFAESHSYLVADEVNKLTCPVLFILSTEKNDFPLDALKIQNYRIVRIKGDHHFDEKAGEVAQRVNAGIG